ncbi:MAG: hypothetical protein WD250_05440 [Egibacteraceae bacterium]
MPQPGVGLVGAFGDVAAQLCGQVGDQGRVTLVRAVTGQVLTFAFAVDQQRLDTHQIETEPVALLGDNPPPMSGRLTGDNGILEPASTRLVARPRQGRLELPRPTVLQSAAAEHRPVMVDDHQLLDLVGQIDPADRPLS